ncbi:hypothetical protein K6Q96_18840 [Grimontia kaedaensis]|uniref:Uncharacterized protein n=1 Tax=Grimontia kaedaensis TaxID=2872157 RepID=A0ABY4X1Z5_9GAMM|nr:hypothetical protein [Grimontia kaedaensis]USH05271.1 hypothetical protein K6Q96_18840 [Grimontia kaedaensis]
MNAKTAMESVTMLRDPAVVMDPYRLGAMHQTRLSFVRSLLRKMESEQWKIECVQWDIAAEGFGTAVYELLTPNGVYQLVVFSTAIADEERNDRVIAEKWDVTMALVKGRVDQSELERLRQNVPLQEAGRNTTQVLVLSRANKSVRVFEHLIDALSLGQQPDAQEIANVGYILRTTAVYGNGKFGIADFETLNENPDFRLSFSAQMCAVYILREFSLDWVHFLAKQKGGVHATTLSPELQRYIGVGNATGLGMAPYLIRHPRVVDNWLTHREMALAAVSQQPICEESAVRVLLLLRKARKHLQEVVTIDEHQKGLNAQSVDELPSLEHDIVMLSNTSASWADVISVAEKYSFETQEILVTCLLETFPDVVDPFCNEMNADESLSLTPGIKVSTMISLLETRYKWALDIDFSKPDNQYWFWYRSQDKEEPRMAVRGEEPGEERELGLDVGRQASRLYHALKKADATTSLAEFLLENSGFRMIARRIWTLGNCLMGDIQINALAKNVLPMHLLRCKLSMFGATKFDPRSDRWVRVTLFQGAPTFSELGNDPNTDSWLFPVLTSSSEQGDGL